MTPTAPGIYYDVPMATYRSWPYPSVSQLRHMLRSPAHALAASRTRATPAMQLGTAIHAALLQPALYATEYVTWERVTAAGSSAPRYGRAWDEFCAAHPGKHVLSRHERSVVDGVRAAVQQHRLARCYLQELDAEVSLVWDCGGVLCKSRIDGWRRADALIVGLKTAHDASPSAIGRASHRYGYHLQWAFYHDALRSLGHAPAQTIEIVAEKDDPHDVVVYSVGDLVLERGRELYQQCVSRWLECARTNAWTGSHPESLVDVSLPEYAYTDCAIDAYDAGIDGAVADAL